MKPYIINNLITFTAYWLKEVIRPLIFGEDITTPGRAHYWLEPLLQKLTCWCLGEVSYLTWKWSHKSWWNPMRQWKSHGMLLKKDFDFAGSINNVWKSRIFLQNFKPKRSKYFWKKFRRMRGKVNSSFCIYWTSNLSDVDEIFDKKYNKVINDSECQSSTTANDPKFCLFPDMFSLIDLDTAINGLNLGKRFDHVHNWYFEQANPIF